MDAKPLHTLAKSPQNLAPLPILPRCRSFPEMWCRLAALSCPAFLNSVARKKKNGGMLTFPLH